jgi:hypothetical protein
MATTVKIYAESESDLIRGYIGALTITNGIYIVNLDGLIYIIDW